MSHEEAQGIMSLVEQHRQYERQVANRYWALAAILALATLAMVLM